MKRKWRSWCALCDRPATTAWQSMFRLHGEALVVKPRMRLNPFLCDVCAEYNVQRGDVLLYAQRASDVRRVYEELVEMATQDVATLGRQARLRWYMLRLPNELLERKRKHK